MIDILCTGCCWLKLWELKDSNVWVVLHFTFPLSHVSLFQHFIFVFAVSFDRQVSWGNGHVIVYITYAYVCVCVCEQGVDGKSSLNEHRPHSYNDLSAAGHIAPPVVLLYTRRVTEFVKIRIHWMRMSAYKSVWIWMQMPVSVQMKV